MTWSKSIIILFIFLDNGRMERLRCEADVHVRVRHTFHLDQLTIPVGMRHVKHPTRGIDKVILTACV